MTEVPRGLGSVLAFVLGACVGSFVGVVAYRLPREISITTPRSRCESCNRPIPAWANIPVLAYLGLRGRCLMCGAPIPFRYFLSELGMALAALYLFRNFALLDAVARFILCAALLAVSLIDYDWRIIPNAVTFPAIPLGVILAWLVIPEVGLKSSLIGVAVGAGFLFLTGEVYRLIRGREGVGLGDVFLIGMVGAFVGWPSVLFTIFVGSLLGSLGGIVIALARRSKAPQEEETGEASVGGGAADARRADALLLTEVPFGPFLSLAAGIYALFQPQILGWYLAGQ